MNRFFTNNRSWFVGAIFTLSFLFALAPIGQVMADNNPIDPPIGAPADPGLTPPDTTIVPDPPEGINALSTWDIIYAIIVAL